MKFWWNIGWILAVGLFLAACEKQASSAPPPPADPANSIPTKVQPKLPTTKIWVGSQELETEIARTDLQIHTGMMFRTNVAENEAMLFVFPYSWRVSFWMKNVPIPLSCAYIDKDGVILETHDMKAQDTNVIEAASSDIQFVLETKQGWFERNKIATGMVVRTERGSLAETFIRPR